MVIIRVLLVSLSILLVNIVRYKESASDGIQITYDQQWVLKWDFIRRTLYIHETSYHIHLPANDEEAAPVSSELCANQREARIVDVLWHHGHQRGCTIRPVQKICISPWISFPNTPKNIPIRINSPQTVEETIADPIYVLVEAQFAANVDDQLSEEERDRSMDHSNSLEEFGDPVAWRADVNFSFLLRTSKEQLLKFILASFLANNLAINDDLQILRIQCR